MSRKEYIMDFANHMCMTFSILIVSLSICSLIIGGKIKDYSSLFVMGQQGLSVETIFQMLLSSLIITSFRGLIYSELIKNTVSRTKRASILASLIFVLIVIFIHLFRWFPKDATLVWVVFALSFSISTILGIYLSFLSEQRHNRNMSVALEQLQKKIKENNNVNKI